MLGTTDDKLCNLNIERINIVASIAFLPKFIHSSKRSILIYEAKHWNLPPIEAVELLKNQIERSIKYEFFYLTPIYISVVSLASIVYWFYIDKEANLN